MEWVRSSKESKEVKGVAGSEEIFDADSRLQQACRLQQAKPLVPPWPCVLGPLHDNC